MAKHNTDSKWLRALGPKIKKSASDFDFDLALDVASWATSTNEKRKLPARQKEEYHAKPERLVEALVDIFEADSETIYAAQCYFSTRPDVGVGFDTAYFSQIADIFRHPETGEIEERFQGVKDIIINTLQIRATSLLSPKHSIKTKKDALKSLSPEQATDLVSYYKMSSKNIKDPRAFAIRATEWFLRLEDMGANPSKYTEEMRLEAIYYTDKFYAPFCEALSYLPSLKVAAGFDRLYQALHEANMRLIDEKAYLKMQNHRAKLVQAVVRAKTRQIRQLEDMEKLLDSMGKRNCLAVKAQLIAVVDEYDTRKELRNHRAKRIKELVGELRPFVGLKVGTALLEYLGVCEAGSGGRKTIDLLKPAARHLQALFDLSKELSSDTIEHQNSAAKVLKLFKLAYPLADAQLQAEFSKFRSDYEANKKITRTSADQLAKAIAVVIKPLNKGSVKELLDGIDEQIAENSVYRANRISSQIESITTENYTKVRDKLLPQLAGLIKDLLPFKHTNGKSSFEVIRQHSEGRKRQICEDLGIPQVYVQFQTRLKSERSLYQKTVVNNRSDIHDEIAGRTIVAIQPWNEALGWKPGQKKIIDETKLFPQIHAELTKQYEQVPGRHQDTYNNPRTNSTYKCNQDTFLYEVVKSEDGLSLLLSEEEQNAPAATKRKKTGADAAQGDPLPEMQTMPVSHEEQIVDTVSYYENAVGPASHIDHKLVGHNKGNNSGVKQGALIKAIREVGNEMVVRVDFEKRPGVIEHKHYDLKEGATIEDLAKKIHRKFPTGLTALISNPDPMDYRDKERVSVYSQLKNGMVVHKIDVLKEYGAAKKLTKRRRLNALKLAATRHRLMGRRKAGFASPEKH